MSENKIRRTAKSLETRLIPLIKAGADTPTRQRVAVDRLRTFIEAAKAAEKLKEAAEKSRDSFEHLADMLEGLAKRERNELERLTCRLESFEGLEASTVEDFIKLEALKTLYKRATSAEILKLIEKL